MKQDLTALAYLIRRHFKIFLKDRAAVFFSLLAPIIVLLLYVLFLGDVQMTSIEQSFEGSGVETSLLRAVVDGWMLAGVMAVACITVSFSAHNVMIRDREEGIVADVLTSPVKRGVLSASYFVYNVVVTLTICVLVLIVAFIYLAIVGWYLSAGDVFAILGLLIVSVLSASLFSTIVCSFFRTGSAHGAFIGILSAAIGFLVGAFMPLSMFPKAVQYLVLILPGTYSAGVFRNLFMTGALNEVAKYSAEGADAVRDAFSMSLDFFGVKIGADVMWGILAGSIVLLGLIAFAVSRLRNRGGALLSNPKRPKRSRN